MSLLRVLATGVLAGFAGTAPAVTGLLYDTEPNNAPHQAVATLLPDDNNALRILGELEGRDQDAYRLIVDEDQAGRRFNLRLTGRAGALTRLDVFDFSGLADGRGRIPEQLTQRPRRILTLEALDGGRAAQADALLFPPGVYVLGVSHSGGSGAYTVELVAHDSSGVRVLDETNTEASPQRLSPNGRQVVWTQGESWFQFELDEDEAARPWDFAFQSGLGRPATVALMSPEGETLLSLETEGGEPVFRPGLILSAGVHSIRTEQQAAGVQWLTLPRGAAEAENGSEVEPNDTVPMTVPFGEPVRGRFDEGDTDWLRFEVGAEQAARRWQLDLTAGTEGRVEICLNRRSMGLQHCERGAAGRTTLHSLGLSEGVYRVRMSDRGPAGTAWELTWTDLGPLRPGEEIEPNDKSADASPLHDRGFGRGSFDGGREIDHWRFNVSGDPQLWRIQNQGDDLFELTLKRVGGETLSHERGGAGGRIRLDNQFLLPGEYVVAASGHSGDYTLRVLPLGPPPEGMELEPNDDLGDARRMRFGQQYVGLLAEDGDIDQYRFTLFGHERVRLRVEPPADGRIRVRVGMGDDGTTISELRRTDELGTVMEWTGFLPPAEYAVSLSAFDVSDAEYKVTLLREDWLADGLLDREPNDWPAAAIDFPADGILEGRVGVTRASQDWYRLPVVDAPTRIELPNRSGLRYTLRDVDADEDVRLERDREAEAYFTELAPGTSYLLKLHGEAEYRLDLSALVAGGAEASATPPTVAITVPDAPIQAFSPWAQRASAEVAISNPGAEPVTASLTGHLTDLKWSFSGLPGAVTLDAGETRTLPVEIEVAPDALDIPDVQFSVRAAVGAVASGAQATIRTEIDAVPQAPTFHWPMPEAPRGAFNAAASRFGARMATSPNIDDDDLDDFTPLFDGLARYGRWTETGLRTPRSGAEDHQQPTVQLAGSEPVPVRAFLLNPTITIHPNRSLREFEIALSTDGENFETVVRGELTPTGSEQAFILDEPVPARYARLIPVTGALGDTGSLQTLKLGEFKVVAERGWRPTDERLNIADPELGGHLVYGEPWIRGSAFNRHILVRDEESPSPRMRGAEDARAVIGFEHARAARVDGFAVELMPADAAGTPPEAVRVSIAVDSPIGPWTPIAESGLAVGADTEIPLDEPVWARYVRFDFEMPDGASSVSYPERIAVYEADGPSVLGEWGHLSRVGPYEAEFTPQPPALAEKPTNTDRDSALELAAGRFVPGRALLDEFSSWYRLTPTDTDNRLELILRARPSVEGAPRLIDSAGDDVTLHPVENTGTEAIWEAWIEPGADYWVEVYEPPRSVIFSWDTSGSVAFWLPTISRALMTYAETIEPGRDEVNLLPFGHGQPLLENWQGNPYPLMRMLAADPQETSSSNAEGTLSVAAREMIGRPGKKAVLLVTDAATSTDARLWPALRAGRPQVFAMKLSSEGAFAGNPVHEVDLMQDWAMVRGGHFEYVTGLGVLGTGFDRAVARLKRPVDFEVEVSFETVDEPSPATVGVDFGDGSGEAGLRGAVEIILDASGSMLKGMAGTRRIDVAKDAIRRTVEESLPDGLPLALRVYGHREAGSCRTDLEIPPEPLDKASFLARVASIQAVNLARTPIADSLAAVASDLSDIEGRKRVVLLTDGEETCDGDPAEAIRALQEAGVDVRVDIVGFAIDDEALKNEFAEWARIGGGAYLDAAEAEALGGALERALQVPFAVIDESGETVATGVVGGDPVAVPPGRYTIRAETATPYVARDVTLAPGDRHAVEID